MPVTTMERSAFIESNLGLVHACAGRFRGRGIEYEDLYSAGCVGLVKACDGFDESRGLCFSTYAVPVILGEIKKLFRDGGSVKVSRSVKDLSLKIAALRELDVKREGAEPPISKLAEELGVGVEQVADAIAAAQPTISLTPASDEDGPRELDIREESCEERVTDLVSLRDILCRLPLDERRLICLRFFKNKTQSETARILGVTQVQISRRERKILSRLRSELLETDE